jgi:hypothetical protein
VTLQTDWARCRRRAGREARPRCTAAGPVCSSDGETAALQGTNGFGVSLRGADEFFKGPLVDGLQTGIARLDRLARSTAMIAGLMDCGVDFKAEVDALIDHVVKWSSVANTFIRAVNLEVKPT